MIFLYVRNYRASYEDGRLKGEIKTCAGNQGTQITVEDLFFNCPQRKQMFKLPSEEYQRVLDVVSKYSIHNANVGFLLNKQGENAVALRTPLKSTKIANIRSIYGADIASKLIEIDCDDVRMQFQMQSLVTNVKYSSKKFALLLFINHRLVECSSLKNAIDQVYGTFLPKGSHPFVYINLQIESNNVDVNVHPTKHEVNFLYESEIIEKIKAAFEQRLIGSNEARDLYTQQLLPGASNPTDGDDDRNKSLSQGKEIKIYAKDMIRSDSKEQKLEKFYGQTIKASQTLTQNSDVFDESFSKDNHINTTKTIVTPILPTRSIECDKKYDFFLSWLCTFFCFIQFNVYFYFLQANEIN